MMNTYRHVLHLLLVGGIALPSAASAAQAVGACDVPAGQVACEQLRTDAQLAGRLAAAGTNASVAEVQRLCQSLLKDYESLYGLSQRLARGRHHEQDGALPGGRFSAFPLDLRFAAAFCRALIKPGVELEDIAARASLTGNGEITYGEALERARAVLRKVPATKQEDRAVQPPAKAPWRPAESPNQGPNTVTPSASVAGSSSSLPSFRPGCEIGTPRERPHQLSLLSELTPPAARRWRLPTAIVLGTLGMVGVFAGGYSMYVADQRRGASAIEQNEREKDFLRDQQDRAEATGTWALSTGIPLFSTGVGLIVWALMDRRHHHR